MAGRVRLVERRKPNVAYLRESILERWDGLSVGEYVVRSWAADELDVDFAPDGSRGAVERLPLQRDATTSFLANGWGSISLEVGSDADANAIEWCCVVPVDGDDSILAGTYQWIESTVLSPFEAFVARSGLQAETLPVQVQSNVAEMIYLPPGQYELVCSAKVGGSSFHRWSVHCGSGDRVSIAIP